MSARRMILAAVVLGLCAAQAAAQTARDKELEGKQLRQMYEDIAVFRTLLNRAIEKSYGFPHQMAPQPRDHFHQFAPAAAEGVYLPGRGVVYNLRAPLPAQGPLGMEAGAAAKEPSDWERVRQELRGGKLPTPKDQAPPRPSLSESVLRLLAENGRHFKELADGEQITVAITFRGSLDCAQCHSNPFQSQGGGMKPTRYRSVLAAQLGRVEVRSKDTVVGDLHLRQGRYQEAVQAYNQALQALLRGLKSTKTEADVPRLLAAVELAGKMANALQAAGNNAEAEQARAMSLKYADAAVKLAASLKGGKTEKGTITLPERLIVSAPKKLLDQAGAGKLSFADFRKAARVQHLRFPRPEK